MTRSVLFVCLGNICRSPTAEAVFRGLAQGRGLLIDSAGTSGWHDGGHSDPRASAEAARRGYDMSMIRSRQVCKADFDHFDLIIAMDTQNLADLRAVQPDGSSARLELFLDYAPEFGVSDVLDHYNTQRTHQGKMCCGRTPFETMIEGKEIWKEKFVN